VVGVIRAPSLRLAMLLEDKYFFYKYLDIEKL